MKETHDSERKPVLCGFVRCHGNMDFSLHEVELSKADAEAIEKILAKYQNDGSSVRNAWEERLCDSMMPEYSLWG